MAVHRTALTRLCRLCSSSETDITEFKHKEEFQGEILQIWNINVCEDAIDIHPPKICAACRLKILRWKKNKRKKGQSVSHPRIDIRQFLPHHVECEICEGPQWTSDVLLVAFQKEGYFAWEYEQKVVGIKVNREGSIVTKRIVADIAQKQTECYVLGRKFPMILSPQEALGFLSAGQLCTGNTGFPELEQHYKDVGLIGRDGQLIAKVEGIGDSNESSTIRHVGCQLFISGLDVAEERSPNPNTTCDVCTKHRYTLFALLSRLKKGEMKEQKHKPTMYMSNIELRTKVTDLQRKNKNVAQQNRRLVEKVKVLMDKECVEIEDVGQKCIEEIVAASEKELGEALSAGSYCKLLWDEQRKAQERKAKGRRWHPAILKWAIAIHSRSASTYDLLRKSGFLVLPHTSTLYEYTHFTNPQTGVNPELLMRYYADWKIHSMQNHQKLVTLLIDEMKVKSGLVFSKSTGKLVGFSEVGSLNEEMKSFERKCKSLSEEDPEVPDLPLASHVLLYMVRGLTTKMKFPAAYYATTNVTGTQLYETAMEVIGALRVIGLTVICLTSDGASSNRKLYEMLGGPVPDPLSPPHSSQDAFGSGQIFFFCDPPHLLKTLRNNFENSNWNRKTRNLVFRGNRIQWTHLIQLQEWDRGKDRSAPGLRLLHKLSYEHLHLNPGLRMKVSLAAQVMSSSVANALEIWKKPGLDSTVLFIRNVNKFFDCLNVSSIHAGKRKKNDNLLPYYSVDDPRLKWLEEDFLGFLQEWLEEGTKQTGISAKERSRLCLSNATITGCFITVRSFVKLTKLLLGTEGVEYVLSDKLNQDPLEEFFSKQRASGGHHDNPTVEQFGHSLVRNVVAGHNIPGSSRGNVRTQEMTEEDITVEPLPKRKRLRVKSFLSKEAPN